MSITTMADPTVHIPDFLAAELESGDDLIHARDRLQQKSWLTDELVNEITGLFPNSDNVDPMTGADRIFASEKQVDQVAATFLEAWAVVKARNGEKITCHHGLNTKKSTDSPFLPSLPRERAARKSKVQCPFKIACSHQGMKASLKKPGMFCHAKITTTHLSRTGHLEVNVEGMKDVLSLLSQKPRVACQILRPMLECCLPQWKGSSAQHANNFRRQVASFLMKNPDFRHLTCDQAHALS
jgi:hypothetical protein